MTEASQRTPFAAQLAGAVLDAAAFAGAGLIVFGVDLIYRPAAFIVGGVFLLGGAWLIARRISA
ncbi:MAG: hypothetical protein WA840_00975 [Caulobacteraceae bacterium]